jgi:hypothetical protein
VTAQRSVTVAARAAAAAALQILDMGSLPPHGDKRRSPSVPLFLGAHLFASVRSIMSTSHAAAIAWPVVPDVSQSGTRPSFACCGLRSSRSPAALSMFGRRRAPRCPDACEIGRQGLRLLDPVPRAAHRNRSANMCTIAASMLSMLCARSRRFVRTRSTVSTMTDSLSRPDVIIVNEYLDRRRSDVVNRRRTFTSTGAYCSVASATVCFGVEAWRAADPRGRVITPRLPPRTHAGRFR